MSVLCRCFVLLVVALSAATTSADEPALKSADGRISISTAPSNATQGGGLVLDLGDRQWSRPWGVVFAFLALLIAAALAPLVVPRLLSAFIRKAQEEDPLSGGYGTFSPTTTLERTPTVPIVDPSIKVSDLPPPIEVKWDRSAWKLMHKQLDFPIALAVSAALLSAAFAVIHLPSHYDWIQIRHTVNELAQLFMIVTACFALHRVVELVIEFMEGQAWLARTHMHSLFRDIASQFGVAVKVMGMLVIIVSVLGLTDDGKWSRKFFFAFAIALAIGLLGWVLLELSDTVTAMSSATLIMSTNMFAVGDDVEMWIRDHGGVRGVVTATGIGRTQLVFKGKRTVVPNANFLKAALINHTRSHIVISVTAFVNPKSGAEKMRAFSEGARRIAAAVTVAGESSGAYYNGPVAAGNMPLLLTATCAENTHPATMRATLLMQLLQLARTVGVQLEQ